LPGEAGAGQRELKDGEGLSPWITYPAALVSVGGAAIILRLLAPWIGSTVPVSLFVLAVTLSAWLGGVGPGLLATAVSLIVAHLYSLKPDAVLPITRASYLVRFILFAVAGVAISVISEKRRRAAARATDALAQAEERTAELGQSQARFQRIVETAQEGIWHVDAEGRTVYANQHLADMLGYRVEELMGRSAFDLVPEEEQARAREAWTRRAAGSAERLEFRFRHRNGHVVWLRASATPLLEDGRFAGAFAMLTDVTEARRNEEALRAGEARKATQLAVTEVLAQITDLDTGVRRILEAACHGLEWCCGALWLVDRETNVLRCSEFWADPDRPVSEFAAVTRRTLLSPGVGLPGRVWTSMEGAWIPDLEQDNNFLRKPAALAAGLHGAFAFPVSFGREILGVFEFFSPDPREPDLELLRSFLGVGSQVGQFLERMRIEHERQSLLESEQAARREAEAANRAKDEFLATLSHELRTPLNAIVGWSHLLRTGQLDESQRVRAIEVIDRNAKAQSQIVADVLDVSRIVMGKLRLDVHPVELETVVEEAVDTLRPAAAAKEIQIETALSPGARVSGDPDRLQQVVWNLVSNAIKFTPSGGHIRASLRQVDGHVEVVVEDSGAGIRPDFLPHVFERFRQSDSSSTRAHGGLGLGLALVRHIVELHGGTVAADSRGAGQGATFTVRLPLMLPEPREAPDDAARSIDLQGLQVLVVDDDRETRELVATALRGVGAQVRTAGNTVDALADVGRHRPSVIVSDLEMPGEDGYQLIRRLRALAPEQGGTIPAAALTAHAQPDEVRRALEAGFQRHLPKPAAPDEIARAVAALARAESES
jgi:PAS domain S-box-containing protein